MNIKCRNVKKSALSRTDISTCSLLVLILGLVIGCGNNSMQPESQADAISLSAASKVAQGNDFDCFESSGLITVSDGGEIQLGWGGPKNSLKFAPGAVAEDVDIDITTCIVKGNAQNSFSVIELEFSPDGVYFSTPAQIVINAGSLNALRAPNFGGVVRLYFYNPDTGEWLVLQEARIIKGKVTFEIDHFSKFGISH